MYNRTFPLLQKFLLENSSRYRPFGCINCRQFLLCAFVLRYSLLLRKYMLKIFSKSFKVCIFHISLIYLINICIHKWTYLFVCFFPCTVPMVCSATSLIYIFPEILGLISGFSGHLFVSSCKDYRFFSLLLSYV